MELASTTSAFYTVGGCAAEGRSPVVLLLLSGRVYQLAELFPFA